MIIQRGVLLNRTRYLFPAIFVLAFSSVGCASLAKKFFDPPQAGVDRIEIKNVALTGTEFIVHVKIVNPNSVGATLKSFQYVCDIDGERIVEGVRNDKTQVLANDTSFIELPVTVLYSGLRSGIKGALTKKTLPLHFEAKLVLDSPIGDLKFDIKEDQDIPVPDRPRFDLQKVELGEFSISSATLRLHIKISNNHDFKLDIRKFRYEFSLQDNLISAADVAVEKVVSLDEAMTVVLPINVKLLGLKRSVVDMLQSGVFKYSMKFDLDLNTHFGPVTLPYERDGMSAL